MEQGCEDVINLFVSGLRQTLENLITQEITMYLPADPKEAYKMGVKMATEQLYSGYDAATVFVRDVNKKLEERRQNLLTKKVTKWFFLYNEGFPHRPVTTSSFYDTEEEARKASLNAFGEASNRVLNSDLFSVTIKEPL